MTLDVARIRKDFPILDRQVRGGQPLIYLDSANTSQKPRQVIDALTEFYERHNANIHRANHELGEEATAAYEGARIRAARFIGAADETEVIFTKNISEGINLVAYSMGNASAARPGSGRFRLGPGDEIVITEMEHHSNIVPWQMLCERTGATLRWFKVTGWEGRLDLSAIGELITERTKLVALVHQSNVLGTVNPVRQIAEAAHAVGALVLVDAAQSVPHMPVDVTGLGADFLGFTGHKLCGPTGIGVLWGRRELLAEMPPFLGGGEMIETVWMERSTYAPPPHKFEAGTMPIAQAVGLAAAMDYLDEIGRDAIHAHEQQLLGRALTGLAAIAGVRILGPSAPRTASPSGPGTTAPGRCTARSASRPAPGPRSTCTTPSTRWTRWSREYATRSGSSRWREGRTDATAVAVPGDHPRPLPAPAPQRPA
jgi:cysteine desulfurase / selenocysteine lyase